MLRVIIIMLFLTGVCSCGTKREEPAPSLSVLKSDWELPKLPAHDEAEVRKVFKGAMRVCEFNAIILHYLEIKYGIPSQKILMGSSTCVDDIIYSKNFHSTKTSGMFHLGGLAGLPFTGITGLNALAHHVPDEGTMLLLLEPHIGYSSEKGWGYLLRYDQLEPSSCCGALMGTLNLLQNNKLNGKIRAEDYQEDKIAQFALKHKRDILKADIPIVEFTKMISREAERQIRAHVLEVDMEHINYIVILTGVMINTDYNFSDYQVVKHIVIYNVKKKTFTEEILIP